MEHFRKILVIPDVHGRSFWKGSVNAAYDHIVFLGDYLDPYPFERISVRKAHANLLEIIEYKKQNEDRVTLLLGNHDMHYCSELFYELAGGSRYDMQMAPTFQQLFQQEQALFQLAYEAEVDGSRYLFTHAGVNRAWYLRHQEEVGELDADHLNRLLTTDEGIRAISDVGYSRGGYEPTGGPMWADVSEMYFSPHFSDFHQVIGHSQQAKDPIIEESFACLDCRRAFVISDKGLFPLI